MSHIPEPDILLRGRTILPDRILQRGAVRCRGGRIIALGEADALTSDNHPRPRVIDAGDGYIAPGYVDLHVHGGAGADYMDGTPDAVRVVNQAHARHGTTTIFPTTTTGTPEQVRAMLDACLAVRRHASPADGAWIAGVHFYGPYFAEDKVGCHPTTGRRDPDPAEYRAAFDLGIVRIATCAAELPGAEAFYREATKRGYLSTCGHSNASWHEMQRAFVAGMRHVDHFWSAMSDTKSVTQRLGTTIKQASMEQFVLMHHEMSTEVIADGEHLAPELLEFAYRMIGPERLCLVTDANRALDMPAGEYVFGPRDTGATFLSDERKGHTDTGLASSVRGLDYMVRHFHQSTTAPLHEAVRMASLTPARRAGIDDEVGSLTVGKCADILILDQSLHISRLFIGGVEATFPSLNSGRR